MVFSSDKLVLEELFKMESLDFGPASQEKDRTGEVYKCKKV